MPGMKTPQDRRCCQCRKLFEPDPRVGDRQVTCGSPACQRAQHAEACRRWHKSNPEARTGHYRDVVEPYRAQHPSYQRRWRVVGRLREIRDEISITLHGVGERVLRVLNRGRSVQVLAAEQPVQPRAITGQPLSSALTTAARIVEMLGELRRLVAQLEILGGRR
jgi:hypothetical protein